MAPSVRLARERAVLRNRLFAIVSRSHVILLEKAKRGSRLLPDPEFIVRFWGVRGSIAAPGSGTARYGGNTSCVEIRCDGKLFIFDGGSGLRLLGNALKQSGQAHDFDLFFTHTHLDHCHGLPFFAPCYDTRNRIRIWAGHLKPDNGIAAMLGKMMSPPLFPIPLEIFT